MIKAYRLSPVSFFVSKTVMRKKVQKIQSETEKYKDRQKEGIAGRNFNSKAIQYDKI